ncbi:MAG TPA: hypothetical protein VLF59_03605 [Candidatus Saccharimonadales bacterium]|nr:hypothetical protein [Candidatus Saccharimonadales bacterium]
MKEISDTQLPLDAFSDVDDYGTWFDEVPDTPFNREVELAEARRSGPLRPRVKSVALRNVCRWSRLSSEDWWYLAGFVDDIGFHPNGNFMTDMPAQFAAESQAAGHDSEPVVTAGSDWI